MMNRRSIKLAASLTIIGLLCLNVFAGEKPNVLVPYDGPSVEGVDTTTLTGKVVCGYQGWFNCEGDGADLGWTHWARNRNELFAPGNITVDLWPDVSEFDDDELYETGFLHADGSVAKTFSSFNRKTVIRHFEWMRDYGIDGAFIQRFCHSLDNEDRKYHKDVILSNAREGANRTGRTYIVMYDLSGTPEHELVEVVVNDWKELRSKMKITEDPAYLHHDGKPVVAVWGIGFNDNNKPRPTMKVSEELIDALKADGCTVMLGIPTGWLTQTRDAWSAEKEPRLIEVLSKADILSPWTAGRYKNIPDAIRHGQQYWKPDVDWCNANQKTYLPVIHPGFSWHNLKAAELDAVPRLEGKYMWTQAIEAHKAGAEAIYVGMFDEVDEGTAIFKCTNNPPTGNGGKFLTYEGLPSDFYLRLTGKVGELLRGEIGTDFDFEGFKNSMPRE